MPRKLLNTILVITLICTLFGGIPSVTTTERVEAQTSGPYYIIDAQNLYLNAFAYPASGTPYTSPLPGKTFAGYIDGHDQMAFLVSVQGLVNRTKPTLYIQHRPADQQILDKLRSQNLWPGTAQFTTLSNIDAVINTFKSNSAIKGSVVWDDTKPYTMNIATTIAGAEDLVIVRKGSAQYQKITAAFPVKKDLSTQGFTSKSQAYRWMTDQYVSTGKVNKVKFAYLADGHYIKLYKQNKAGFNDRTVDAWFMMIRDVTIGERIAVVDLSPDSRTAPLDLPNQTGAQDYDTFRYFLSKLRAQAGGTEIIAALGFPNRKYISADCNGDGKIDEADYTICGEFSFSKLVSEYGAAKKVGAGAIYDSEPANYSFMKHGPKTTAPLASKVAPLTPQQLISKGYVTGDPNNPASLRLVGNKKFVLFYMGDYDLINGVTHHLNIWDAKQSTTIPVAWGISRDLYEYTPTIYHYLLKTRSNFDYFMMPDSGYGYANPSYIPAQYHSKWIERSAFANRAMGVRSGWYLDGNAWSEGILGSSNVYRNMYAKISPNGVIYASPSNGTRLYNRELAVSTMTDVDFAGKNEDTAAQDLKNHLNNNNQFYTFRTIFTNSEKETRVVNKAKALGANFEVVDPETYFYLMKLRTNNYPKGRFSVVDSQIPSVSSPGAQSFVITVRNDGWNKWLADKGAPCNNSNVNGAGCTRFALYIGTERAQATGIDIQPTVGYNYRINIPRDIAPGETVQLTFPNVTVPSGVAKQYFQVDLVNELEYFGEAAGGIPWAGEFTVTSPAPPPPGDDGGETGLPQPADSNGDGVVNGFDFAYIAINFNKTTCNLKGDLSGDCKVNATDYNLFKGLFRY